MWDSVHEDALTGDSLPTQIEITGLNSYFLSTVLCGYVQNVWQSGALISDVLHAAVVFVNRTPRISVLSEKSTETDPFHGRGFGLEEASLIICVGSENTRWFHFLQFGSALGGPMY